MITFVKGKRYYWTNKPSVMNMLIKNTMSIDRFMDMMSHLHINDNEADRFIFIIYRFLSYAFNLIVECILNYYGFMFVNTANNI